MISVNHRTKLGVLKLKDLFYASNVQETTANCDAVYYYYCKVSAKNAKVFRTLLIDLAPEPDEILKSFRKSTRKEVKKALQDSSTKVHIAESNQEALQAFMDAYDQFAKDKKILPCCRILLQDLQKEKKLVLASATIEDETICQFSLIDAGDKIVAYYGYNKRFHWFQNPEKVRRISRASRILDYHCMLYAKAKGKKHYDFCGLTLNTEDVSSSNVDQYKLGFGGNIVTEYHFLKPMTLKGQFFCWFKNIGK